MLSYFLGRKRRRNHHLKTILSSSVPTKKGGKYINLFHHE